MKQSSFTKNFIRGMGSSMNLFPKPPKNPIAGKSVKELIKSDWKSVSDDIKKAIKEVMCERHAK